MLTGIVAVDANWGIGKDNGLLVHIPGDLKYFKEQTMGKKIVLGRKTLETFPGSKPLPGRENIILTNNASYNPEGVTICHSVEEALAIEGDVMICGGESVYNQFMEHMDTILVTKIQQAFEADKHFTNLDEDPAWKMTWESEPVEEKGVTYTFTKYERV